MQTVDLMFGMMWALHFLPIITQVCKLEKGRLLYHMCSCDCGTQMYKCKTTYCDYVLRLTRLTITKFINYMQRQHPPKNGKMVKTPVMCWQNCVRALCLFIYSALFLLQSIKQLLLLPGDFVCRSRDSSREHSSSRLVQRSVWSGAGFYFPKQRLSPHGNKHARSSSFEDNSSIFEPGV